MSHAERNVYVYSDLPYGTLKEKPTINTLIETYILIFFKYALTL